VGAQEKPRLREAEQRSAGADFDVIGMSADGQDFKRSVRGRTEVQR
jgi:hypothetical protein